MKLLSVSILRGCNVYHDRTVIRQEVDLGEFASLRSVDAGAFFARRFIKRFESLERPPFEGGLPEDFLNRLRSSEGVPLSEALFQAILAVDASMACAMRRFNVIKFAEIMAHSSPQKAFFVWNCCVPSISYRAAEVAFIGLLELLPKRLRAAFATAEEANFTAAYDTLWKDARRHRLPYNSSNMVRALEQKGIPWGRVPFDRGTIRAGEGRFQKLVQNAQTDSTSRVACRLASNKQTANRLLEQARIPVPLQAKADSVEEALAAAEKLGYPLVIKGNNGSKGQTVIAGLRGPSEIPSAFERVRRSGSDAVVESFVEGREYRLLVVNGRYVAGTMRLAPFVTGNGRTTIGKLIERLNRDPRRDDFIMVKITPNEELDRLLDRSGYTLGTVLPNGEKFILESNHRSGGTPIDVTNRVHPDNQKLAVAAAETLALNIAGIDFITPDISSSWKEVGGAIIEVNNAPSLDLHTWPAEGEPRDVAGTIVESMFPNGDQGRVPVALVVSGRWQPPAARLLNNFLQAAGVTVGLVMGKQAFVDGEPAGAEITQHRQAITAVMRDRRVEAVISTLPLERVLRRGLVHEACEVAAIIDTSSHGDVVARQAYEVVVRATRGKLVVGVESSLAMEGVDPCRLILVSPNASTKAARHRVEAHLASGGSAVVSGWGSGAHLIELLEGNQTLACLPADWIAGFSGTLSPERLEAHLFAVALARGMGLSEQTITSALRSNGLHRVDGWSRSEVSRPAAVASPMSHP
jgi:cyanophycin synthetase